jgi:hypothetical protein
MIGNAFVSKSNIGTQFGGSSKLKIFKGDSKRFFLIKKITIVESILDYE